MINRTGNIGACIAFLFLLGSTEVINAQPLSTDEPLVNPKLLKEIERTDYTPEERRNIDIMIEFFRTKNPMRSEIMERYFSKDHVVIRNGMETLANTSGIAFSADAMSDRVDYLYDMVVKGDRVALIFYIRGSHDGTFYGIPATGKPINAFEVAFMRMKGGKIVESWWGADELALIKQIGVSTGIPKAGGEE